jgi:hypothetical protein
VDFRFDLATHEDGRTETMSNSRRVSCFYDIEIGNYHYGQGSYPDHERSNRTAVLATAAGVSDAVAVPAMICWRPEWNDL